MLVSVAVWTRVSAPTLPGVDRQLRGDALAAILYVANWRLLAAHQSYFAQFTGPSPLQHLWSLGIEEQFYVVWPLAIVATAAIVRRRA